MRFSPIPRLLHAFALCATVLLSVGGGFPISGAHAAKTPETAAEFYDHAVELIAKGDLKGAVIQLKNALQKDPKDLSARILLGRTYVDLGDGKSAEEQLQRARRDGAKDSFVTLPLGRAYLIQGKYGKLLEEIQPAGLDAKSAAEVTMIRGDAHFSMRSYLNAEKSYLEASRMRPTDAKPLVALARVKQAMGDKVGARNYVKWALQADRRDPKAWYVKGEIAEQAGKIDEALESFDRAIELAPEFPRARLARAAIRVDSGQLDDAVADLEVVRNKEPQNPRALFLMSLILTDRGKVDEAQELLAQAEEVLKGYSAPYMMANPSTVLLGGIVTYFRKDYDSSYRLLRLFLRQVPRHAGARKLIASIALARNEPADTIRFLQPLNPQRSDDIEILIMYGDALARVKRYREASAILKRADSIAKPGSSALFKLVVVRLGAGQGDEAINRLKSEIQRDPDAVDAAIMLASAQLKRRDYKEAFETLEVVTERQPENALAHNLAGGALVGLGRLEEARASYSIAVELSPNYIHAIENLAKVEGRLGKLDKAMALFTQILEKDPRNGKAMMAIADIHLRRNEQEDSFRWLEKARASSRDSEPAAFRLVDLYIATGRPDKALLVARILQSEHPSRFETIVAVGRSMLALKNLEGAAATFASYAALAAERKSAPRLHEAATWLLRARDTKGARESLEKALALNAKHIPSHLQLIRLDLAAGALDAALDRAKQVTSFEPEAGVGQMMQGEAYMRLKKYDYATKAFEAALEKKASSLLAERAYAARRAAGNDALAFAQKWAEDRKDDRIAQRLLAAAYGDAGKYPDAIAIYEGLLKKSPNNVSLLNNLAVMFEQAGDPRALEFARRAYEGAPTEPSTMDTYGWTLVRHGRTEEGMAILRNAKLRAPDVPEIRYHLAVALNSSGKPEEAIEELREALKLNHVFDGAQDARALLTRLTGPAQ